MSSLLSSLRGGDLTLTGLLYEGTFGEWQNRINRLLTIQDKHYFTNPVYKAAFMTENTESAIRKVAVIICSNVSPELLRRIPQDDRVDGWRLMRQLEAFAKPFAFLKLPIEIRKRVYAFELSRRNNCLSEGDLRKPRKPHNPEVTLVSKEIRRESLPVFYAAAMFSIGGVNHFVPGSPAPTFLVGQWARLALGHNSRYLGHVRIKLTASVGRGLSIKRKEVFI